MKNRSNKLIKRLALFAGQIIATTVLVLVIEILFVDGMFLTGVPAVDDVERAVIEYPAISAQSVEVTDREKIELAVKLTGFLDYNVFGEANESGTPLVTITYYLSDGRELSVAANNDTVWWKGRARLLKDDETFVNLTRGIFFG